MKLHRLRRSSSPSPIEAGARGLLIALQARDREARWLQEHRALESVRREALRYPLRDAAALLYAQLDSDVERVALILAPYSDVQSLQDLIAVLGVLVRLGVDELTDREAAGEALWELLLQLGEAA